MICYQGCCESGGDSDHDGVIDAVDNCISVPNEDQGDCDGDELGDNCDNCPADFDPNNTSETNPPTHKLTDDEFTIFRLECYCFAKKQFDADFQKIWY